MKKLKYIYALLKSILLGFVISSCGDSAIYELDYEDADELSYSGETVRTTFTIGISAPDVSADFEAETRAIDNANIDYAQPENGGRFKNIVVLLVDHNERVYGIHCKEFDNASGVKEYNVVFSDIEIPSEDVAQKKQYKVYAFGNICKEHYDNIVNNDGNRDFRNNHVNSTSLNLYTYCIKSTISIVNSNNIWNSYSSSINMKDIPEYNINFTPGVKYYVNSNNVTNDVTSVGMPENRSVTATVVKGNTQFNVQLKRVCARVKITFRNLTGQYIDYKTGTPLNNNVYIDEFKTTSNIFARSTKYLYDGNETYSAEAPFDILQMLDCKVNNKTASDHDHNKIKNGESLTVSMYVFAVNLGNNGLKYNLKVDRGKSLGTNTTVIDPENAYVIWNNSSNVTNPSSISYRNGKIQVSNKQTSYELIPFSDQVFWQLVEAPKPHVDNVYALKHFQIDINTDRHVESNIYLTRVTDSYIDWGILGAFYSYKHINSSPATQLSKAQYVQFRQEESNTNKFTMNLLNADNVNREYWDRPWYPIVGYTERHVMLTLCDDSDDANNKNQLSTQRSDFWGNGNKLGNYDWTLYAKYIIKKDQYLGEGKVKENKEATKITQIERNHSYELEYNVMPNYTDEDDLFVKCVRNQSSIDWEETQK